MDNRKQHAHPDLFSSRCKHSSEKEGGATGEGHNVGSLSSIVSSGNEGVNAAQCYAMSTQP